MATMMMMAALADRGRQILNIGQLTRCGGGCEILGELRELRRTRGIAAGGIGLRGRLQVS